MRSLLLLAFVAAASGARFEGFTPEMAAQGIPGVCPTPISLQSAAVKSSFNVTKIQGYWYELAMKDATQPRFCKCTTSDKKVIWAEKRLSDNFTIECKGAAYSNDLSFGLTNQTGVFHGTWRKMPFVDNIVFPDTVVDFGLNADGTYDWVIEFQCVQGPKLAPFVGDWIVFYAFNFYARRYDNSALIKTMVASARAHGLSAFLDTGKPLAIVDHTGCVHGHHEKPRTTPAAAYPCYADIGFVYETSEVMGRDNFDEIKNNIEGIASDLQSSNLLGYQKDKVGIAHFAGTSVNGDGKAVTYVSLPMDFNSYMSIQYDLSNTHWGYSGVTGGQTNLSLAMELTKQMFDTSLAHPRNQTPDFRFLVFYARGESDVPGGPDPVAAAVALRNSGVIMIGVEAGSPYSVNDSAMNAIIGNRNMVFKPQDAGGSMTWSSIKNYVFDTISHIMKSKQCGWTP